MKYGERRHTSAASSVRRCATPKRGSTNENVDHDQSDALSSGIVRAPEGAWGCVSWPPLGSEWKARLTSVPDDALSAGKRDSSGYVPAAHARAVGQAARSTYSATIPGLSLPSSRPTTSAASIVAAFAR